MNLPRLPHYILVGHEPKLVDLLTWARWLESGPDVRRVAFDYVGEVLVSTVFLAAAPLFETRRPRMFETMIFGGAHDLSQWRYATWDEAVAGHERALYLVQEMTTTP